MDGGDGLFVIGTGENEIFTRAAVWGEFTRLEGAVDGPVVSIARAVN